MMLKGKVSLITGSSRGIGNAMVRRFAEEGAVVYANVRKENELDFHIFGGATDYSGTIIPVYFDVRDSSAIRASIQQIKREQGRLDVLVNNAGTMKDAFMGMVDDETLINTFETNVFGLIHVTQDVLKLMKRQNSGCIINVSSIVGIRGNAGQTAYASSKGAVASLTLTWARELVNQGIRVNAIAPGKIDTDMYQSIGQKKVQEGIEEVGMKRLGSPEEVANVAVFLASDYASYITGEIIGVSGGWFL